MVMYPKFADKLRSLLNKHDRTATWLAGQLGISPSTVNRWLNENTRPRSANDVLKIAKIFGIVDQKEQFSFLKSAGYEYIDSGKSDAENSDQKKSELDEDDSGSASQPLGSNHESDSPTDTADIYSKIYREDADVTDREEGNAQNELEEKYFVTQESKIPQRSDDKRLFWQFQQVEWKSAIVAVVAIAGGGFLLYLLMQNFLGQRLAVSDSDGAITVGGSGNVVNIIQPTLAHSPTSAATPTETQTVVPQITRDIGNLIADFSRATPSGLSKMSVSVTTTMTPASALTESPVQINEPLSTPEGTTVTETPPPLLTVVPTLTPTQTPTLPSEPPCKVRSPRRIWPLFITFRDVPDGRAITTKEFQPGDQVSIQNVSADGRWYEIAELNELVLGWADPEYFPDCIQTPQ